MTLRTGKGTNTGTGVFWGLTSDVWNNDTDRVTLKTAAGGTVHACAYNSSAVDDRNC